ncbi:MAG: response regulator [Alphaproteobacteria bacterium]|nr:response regulator [Alphaproteobacteria bacterium]
MTQSDSNDGNQDKQPLVLVADDEPLFVKTLSSFLEKMGCRVIVADNGHAALKMFRDHAPDLVSLDGQMPGLDGFQVCQAIRGLVHGQDVPILMVTVLLDDESVDKALNVGASDYVSKPIHWPIMKLRLTRMLENIQANRALKVAVRAAEEANQKKSDFLSSMSHELRTPLNAILGFGQMLEFNPKEPLSEGQRASVEHIMSGGQHLLELINQVLDLAKIEAGKVDLVFEDVAPGEIVSDCVTLLKGLAERGGIQIHVDASVSSASSIRVDRVRFKQVLLNLLSNAVKYNRVNGAVTISAPMSPGAMQRLSVSDTGRGVSADQLDALFEPFNRLDAEHSEIEGTGIGLTITKQLVERMGGRIGVESEVGQGSTFQVEMPRSERKIALDDARAQGTLAVAQKDAGAKKGKGVVLYIEDNPANLKLMEMLLQRMGGVTMISAMEPLTGIDMAVNDKPDLIFLDINLPGMTGYEVLEKLKENQQTRDIPVYALTANAMAQDVERGMQSGFRKYITKPFSVNEILSVLKEVLGDLQGR